MAPPDNFNSDVVPESLNSPISVLKPFNSKDAPALGTIRFDFLPTELLLRVRPSSS